MTIDRPALPSRARRFALDNVKDFYALEASSDVVLLFAERPQDVKDRVPRHWLFAAWPKHVYVGTRASTQEQAERLIHALLSVPAAVRFLWCDPLLESVDLDPPTCPTCGGHEVVFSFGGNDYDVPCCREHGDEMHFGEWLDSGASERQQGINWVIVGGATEIGAPPTDLAWLRGIVETCRDAQVPVYVRQLGANPILSPGPITWPTTAPDGDDPTEWPDDLRVWEMPDGYR